MSSPAISRLSARERRILMFGGIFAVALIVIFGVVDPTLTEIRNLDRAIARERTDLEKVRKLAQQFKVLNDRETRIEEKLKGRADQSFSIASVIDDLARTSQIADQIQSLKPDQARVSDFYQESSVSIKATGVNLDRLVDFLYRIETSEKLLRIRSLQIRTHPKKQGTVDVTMTVFTLIPAKEEA